MDKQYLTVTGKHEVFLSNEKYISSDEVRKYGKCIGGEEIYGKFDGHLTICISGRGILSVDEVTAKYKHDNSLKSLTFHYPDEPEEPDATIKF